MPPGLFRQKFADFRRKNASRKHKNRPDAPSLLFATSGLLGSISTALIGSRIVYTSREQGG